MKKTANIILITIIGLILIPSLVYAGLVDDLKVLFDSLFQWTQKQQNEQIEEQMGATVCAPRQGCTGQNFSASTGFIKVESGVFQAVATSTISSATVEGYLEQATASTTYMPLSVYFASTTPRHITSLPSSDYLTWANATSTYFPLSGGVVTASSTIIGNFTIEGDSTTTEDFAAGGVLFVQQDGNVGIGTTTPDSLFEVGTTFNQQFSINDKGAATSTEFTITNGTNGLRITIDGSTTTFTGF